MKRKPLKSMFCKDEMRFVCLNTRYRELRHLVYASHNGADTQRKTVTAKEHCVYMDANTQLEAHEMRRRWTKLEERSKDCAFHWSCPYESWPRACGQAAQLGKMKHSKKSIIIRRLLKPQRNLEGSLRGRGPNNKVTHFILTLFSPPHLFFHCLLLGMEQRVKPFLEQQEACCDSMAAHVYCTQTAAHYFLLRVAYGNMNKEHDWVSCDRPVCPCLPVTFTIVWIHWPNSQPCVIACVYARATN